MGHFYFKWPQLVQSIPRDLASRVRTKCETLPAEPLLLNPAIPTNCIHPTGTGPACKKTRKAALMAVTGHRKSSMASMKHQSSCYGATKCCHMDACAEVSSAVCFGRRSPP